MFLVMKGTNSPFVVPMIDVIGQPYTAVRMATISRMYLKYTIEGTSYYVDSSADPQCFDKTTHASLGLLVIDIGMQELPVGYDALVELTVIETLYPQGRVLPRFGIQISDDALIPGTTLSDPLAVTGLTFDPALSTDHSYSGITSVDVVGESVSFGQLLYRKLLDGKWYLARANLGATLPCLRIALGTITANNSGALLVSGLLRDDSWNWTSGPLYVSAATGGALTETAPTTPGYFGQIVATPLSADTIEFNPSLNIASY